MLVLTRRVGEAIYVGNNVSIIVQRVSGKRVTLCFNAAPNVAILREELAVKTDAGMIPSRFGDRETAQEL